MKLDLFGHEPEERPGPDPEAEARTILADAIEEHDPVEAWVLFSGGDDSMATAAIAMEHPRVRGCFHADTRTGLPENMEWMREVCRRYGWPFEVEATPEDFGEIVVEHGFPGPAQHSMMYRRLKERAFRLFVRRVQERHGGGRVALIGGVRRNESQRRIRLKHAVALDTSGVSGAVWISPLFHWTDWDKARFMAARGIPPNPIRERAGCSIPLDCFCGAMADQGPDRAERKAIAEFFPDKDAWLSELERQAEAAGVWPMWGVKPPATYSRAMRENQTTLDVPMYACTGCERRHQTAA